MRKHRRRGIVAHRHDRLLRGGGHGLDDELYVFAVITESSHQTLAVGHLMAHLAPALQFA